MPRTRVMARRPRALASDLANSSHDDFDALIEVLRALGHDDAARDDEATERPSKRARLSQRVNGIAIARQELVLSGRCLHHVSQDRFTLDGIEGKLRFELVPLLPRSSPPVDEPQYRLHIAREVGSAGASMDGPIRLDFSIPPPFITQELELALLVAQQNRRNPDRPGSLWTTSNVEVAQDGEQSHIKFIFEMTWSETLYLSTESLQSHPNKTKLKAKMLQLIFPHVAATLEPSQDIEHLSPQDFYEAAFVPSKNYFNQQVDNRVIPNVTAKLFPFQRRSVQWMLTREGVEWAEESGKPTMRPLPTANASELPITFHPEKDADGATFYISPIFGVATRDPTRFISAENALKGGILAEEMGLGKTVELISLISLHTRPDGPDRVHDAYVGREVRRSCATLIITPTALRAQWLSEIQRHAPNIKALHYPGMQAFEKANAKEKDLAGVLLGYDVVVTTYDVLKRELHLALEPPKRSMRNERQFERPQSPLVQLSWWRLCIDEAQMVENWATNAATLARLLPRVNSWAVTGTPVKDDVQKDLFGLLSFLRVEPYASNPSVWKLLATYDKPSFQRLINKISLRHSKSAVRSEIELPPQKRYVITMPFTAIEEQHYRTLFEEVIMSCGLDTQGNPISDTWDPERSLDAMRHALDRLRQTALHPEIGFGRRAMGRTLGQKKSPLRTVAEVLEIMIEQCEAAIRVDQRGLFLLQLTKGHLLAAMGQVDQARAIWEEILASSAAIVKASREHLVEEVRRAKNKESAEDDDSDDAKTSGEEEDDELAGAGGRVGEARRRLRLALEVQHKAVFFCGNAYFSIKSNEERTKPDSDDFKELEKLEVESYDRAKAIRKEILQDSQRKVNTLMAKISTRASKQSFAVIPGMKEVKGSGIESRAITDVLAELSALLDEQAEWLDDLREHLIQLLLKPLIDDETEEITGEEYEDSTKLQDEVLVYVTVLRAVISDRQDILSGTSNKRTDQEIETALRQAKEGEGPFPERLIELIEMRRKLKPDSVGPLRSFQGAVYAFRSLQFDLRTDANAGSQRAALELAHVTSQMELAHTQYTEQRKIATALEKEVDIFTSAMNARLEYYRQLQAVSDMVAEYDGQKDEATLQSMQTQENALAEKVAVSESKHRYLIHLKTADAASEEQRLCVICQSTFTVGVLTICGHQFCKDCISMWFKAHRNCPVCKRHLTKANLHDITLKPQELMVRKEANGSQEFADQMNATPTKKSTIYAEFEAAKLAEIRNIDLEGPSYTTKVDNLVRHIFWLRKADPGAKILICSQYKQFLEVLGYAFNHYRVGHTLFSEEGVTAFKDDPAVEVLLLHARAHSSGLNLVNASHVILCEPVVNTAIELQMVSRVDRIGQKTETTVWLYIVDGTVEESIYNLSVRRRMEHMGRSLKGKSKESTPELLDANLEAANSLEMQQASLSRLMGKGTAGELVDKNDLWECLFGHIARPQASMSG